MALALIALLSGCVTSSGAQPKTGNDSAAAAKADAKTEDDADKTTPDGASVESEKRAETGDPLDLPRLTLPAPNAQESKALRLLTYADDLIALQRVREALPYYKLAIQLEQEQAARVGPNRLLTFLAHVGRTLAQHKQYAAAQTLLLKGVTLADKMGAPGEEMAAFMRAQLAWVAYHTKQPAEQVRWLKEAAAIYGQDEKRHAAALGDVLDRWALTLHRAGELDEAELVYNRALRVKEQNLGVEAVELSVTLNNLANVEILRGKFAEAEPLLKRDLSIADKHLPPSHMDRVVTLVNLGRVELALSRWRAAAGYYQQALLIQNDLLGADNPQLAVSWTGLARAKEQMGDLDGAIKAMRIGANLAFTRDAKNPRTIDRLNYYVQLLRKVDDKAHASTWLTRIETLQAAARNSAR
ncbi:putative Tfp pilus assembly protein PilF [Magnetofaba australis IT-1]|uniref:Putative Tfp pilus assembly protein PilF n=2 Tax=Magnetofaba TaxID=1472292 RepID=A0A1Y2K1R7_9PROT|nr:putative Tfp pilus assembly protein PilF [Magnetofaba australis IT-1]